MLSTKLSIRELHVIRGLDVGVRELKGHLMPSKVGIIVAGPVVADSHFVRRSSQDPVEEAIEEGGVDSDGNGVRVGLPGLPPK